jgi:high-affinity Fe2+/Pb2+ permease
MSNTLFRGDCMLIDYSSVDLTPIHNILKDLVLVLVLSTVITLTVKTILIKLNVSKRNVNSMVGIVFVCVLFGIIIF